MLLGKSIYISFRGADAKSVFEIIKCGLFTLIPKYKYKPWSGIVNREANIKSINESINTKILINKAFKKKRKPIDNTVSNNR